MESMLPALEGGFLITGPPGKSLPSFLKWRYDYLAHSFIVDINLDKSPICNTRMQSQNWQNDLCFQGKPFNITVIQAYALTSNAEEVEVEWLFEDLQDLLELHPKRLSSSL